MQNANARTITLTALLLAAASWTRMPAAPMAPGAHKRVGLEASRGGATLRSTLVGLVSRLYPSQNVPVHATMGPEATVAVQLARDLDRRGLSSLVFPGRSDRSRFVVEGAETVVARPSRVRWSRVAYIAWRDGGRFATLADLDGRVLCFSYSTPRRRLTALLLGRGAVQGRPRPMLIWSAGFGVEFEGLASVAGKRLDFKIGERAGPGHAVGTRARVAGWVRAFTHPPAGSLWTRRDPCIGVQLRPGTHSGSAGDCYAIGSDHSFPGGGHGYLLVFGGSGRRKNGPGGRLSGTALMLGVAPLAASGADGYFPACSALPGRMPGIAVSSTSPRLVGKVLMAEMLLAQASVSPSHGDVVALSNFHRLDENPNAVAAFLKWVGGGASAWYRHQGVRRLREICLAGLAPSGGGGQ